MRILYTISSSYPTHLSLVTSLWPAVCLCIFILYLYYNYLCNHGPFTHLCNHLTLTHFVQLCACSIVRMLNLEFNNDKIY